MDESSGRRHASGAQAARAALYLLFQLGGDRFALDVHGIAEVLPLVRLKRIPKAPSGVAGVFDYRGVPVPVVDLSQLVLGRATEDRLSSRIVLVDYTTAGSVERRQLGLLVEKATETLRRDPAEFVAAGVSSKAAPYLGAVSADAAGFVQLLDVQRLLPSAVREALYASLVDAT
jgi:chemotaxis-related protein WspB